MRIRSLVTGAALLAPALASGEPATADDATGALDIVVGAPSIDDLQFARQVVPPSAPNPAAAVAQSRIIYLNKNGVTLSPGASDARINRSSLATTQTAVPPWTVSPTTWAATVACMRELFAPFDVTVVETDPGNVPHIEAVFGGSPQLFGMAANVAGVSPFTTDCSIIENSIVFTFTQAIPQDARTACEIQAQEVAHSFGLDHELLASDPMTYLPYRANRSFQNRTASCGENAIRPCGINGSTCRPDQNSVVLLNERLGPKFTPGDTTPPTVSITSPATNATVPPGFSVNFTAADTNGVKMASLFVDGTAMGSVSTMPYTLVTPADLLDGKHAIRVEVTDGANRTSQELGVTVKQGAAGPSGNTDDNNPGDVTGGCATTRGGSLALALALLGLVLRRKR